MINLVDQKCHFNYKIILLINIDARNDTCILLNKIILLFNIDAINYTCILLNIIYHSGGHLLSLTDDNVSPDDGISQIRTALNDGTAMQKFQELLVAQGVDATFAQNMCLNDMQDVDNVWGYLTKAEHVTDVKALEDGKMYTSLE